MPILNTAEHRNRNVNRLNLRHGCQKMVQSTLFDEVVESESDFARTSARASFSSWLSTPLGCLEIVSDGSNVLCVDFCDESVPGTPDEKDLAGLVAHQQITEYFAGKRVEFSVPVRLTGTPFQIQVWKALRDVSFGQTICYSSLAEKVGVKFGQRAVGMANRQNPIAILIPCHRVIQADGQLCGYAGGLWRKQQLLGLESGQKGLFSID